MNIVKLNRRNFLYGSSIFMSGLIQSCTTKNKKINTNENKLIDNQQVKSKDNYLYIFASSGFALDVKRSKLALNRLINAGFHVYNQDIIYRQFQRFAGTDQERIDDLQNIVKGKVDVPKLLIGLRGGYGAMRLLPYIDWQNLGLKLKDNQTLLVGFSDVCVIQLALLAKGNMSSFSGPMVYTNFGNPKLSLKTVKNFINATTNNTLTINIDNFNINDNVSISGISWGGNLSILSALVGSEYLPKINEGILFIEDISEQPYKIERMFQTLYLAGILQKQKAIVLGSFKINTNNIIDSYDNNYTLLTVINNIRRIIKIPIFTDFPFGHIDDIVTFPLGVPCIIDSTAKGYSIKFSEYPILNKKSLNLDNLLYHSE